MKSIISAIVIAVIAVLMASCTTTQRAINDEYDDDVQTQQSGNRLYVQDPFYGTVVLERDPYTGRYYDVTTGYRGLNSRYNGSNAYRGYRNYNGSYGTYNRGYSNVPVIQRHDSPQQPSQQNSPVNREEARKRILGNNRN